ncbi:MAG TPA: PSD1 and planctomycete cytochrome C domain-containing protein [Tepidisphaeraceae bacterium]|nr:PSD1 and planctomycete cytochrome C domain-containing protein [Tepidisphaeraceae bacterium]
MSRITRFTLCAFGLLLAIPAAVFAGEPSAEGVEFFESQIRPLLASKCYQCHSAKAEKLKGGLLLDSRQGVRAGGKDGPVLVPGEPDKSKLIEAIRYTNPDLQMPPKHQLSRDEVALLVKWVKMGAPDPRVQTGPVAPPAPFDWEKEKQFWSFQAVKDVPVPQVADSTGLESPIDYFLQADYESHHLHPAGPAQKRALIRRATYDLTGLPPTPDEVNAFVADESSNAFEKVVDRLLASPHYGEQWGRHWLDVVRYADTSGCNSDFPIPQAYRYRNYVIDSFNKDKPYDEFVREQLAGDLLPHANEAQKREHLIATGYLAIGRRFGSGASEFYLTIQDILDNVGKTTMGLSIGCARCHDHKFDPISNADYYSLYGIFDSSKFSFPGTEVLRHPKDLIALGTPEESQKLHDYEQKNSALDKTTRELALKRLAIQALIRAQKTPTTQPVVLNGQTLEQVTAALGEAREEQRKLDAQGPPDVETAYGVVEGTPHDARIQHKGVYTDLGPSVPRAFLTILGGQKLPPTETGSGRLELARWITDRSNPLFARVMANRIWEYHFGKGIVSTPNDFGHRGQPPTNPALLDFLATRFMQSGWSIKSMQKLIMLSRAYQMSSEDDAANASIDPGNTYLWRFNPRRLSAEEIRDSVLAVSGSLDPAVDPGPHPFPPQADWKYTQHKPFVADYPTNHRSVYLMQQRIRKQPYLALFDGADTNDTTPDRPLSTTAIQALFMMNDPLMHEQADKLAVQIGMALPDEPQRIEYAYELLFSRPATVDEIHLGQQYIVAADQKLKQAGLPWDQQYRAALSSYLRVLLSSNEFIWLD